MGFPAGCKKKKNLFLFSIFIEILPSVHGGVCGCVRARACVLIHLRMLERVCMWREMSELFSVICIYIY